MEKHSENKIQADFFKWLWNTHPRTRGLCYHIPNGGLRSKREAATLKAMGVIPGIPDIHIAIPACGYSSLYLEFKEPDARMNTEHVKMQLEAHKRLEDAGNKVVICVSIDDAKTCILQYLHKSEYL